jgi:outer membrane protein assembly factor BamD (BamD/ComL family)
VLNPAEKAYLQALQALREKQYGQAAGYFDRAAEFFGNNREFSLLKETTHLLLEVKKMIAAAEGRNDDVLIAEEIINYGKETKLS